MKLKNFIFFVPVILILVAVVLLYTKVDRRFANTQTVPNYYNSSMVGKQLPVLNIANLFDSKKPITNTDIKGKFALVNVFASWCSTCLAEHPLLKQIDNKKIVLIGINWRDAEQDAKNWLGKNGNPYNFVAFDDKGKYGIELGIRGVPETYLVNPEGKIIMNIKGNITEDFLAEVNKKIAE
jgi:cytochrome c biogenesis protein CcmG/thiol:disulfide interchange protein DsbE